MISGMAIPPVSVAMPAIRERDRAAAIAAGFRPHRRCEARPAEEHPAMAQVQAHLRLHADRLVPVAELAGITGLSPAHVQRLFIRTYGYSPKAWQRAWREQLLRAALRKGEGVARAGQGAGYGSGSRIYEHAASRLGMTPARYARGGAGETMSWAIAETAIGLALVAATDRGLCWVALGDDRPTLLADLRAEFPAAVLTSMPEFSRGFFDAWMESVIAAAAGRPHGQANLDIRGTPFQLRVWELLRTIPTGETWSYARLATTLGLPTAARAVAGACAANRIALLIPCHRVVRGNGDVSGYRWGRTRKMAILAAERP
jgi:AraC family transcriptional regulator of adaptative response/methylated-DNA-[protein]-cysteine methyltransferase